MSRARSARQRERESLFLLPTCKPDTRVSPAWVELEARKREPLFIANMKTRHVCKHSMSRARSKKESLYLLPTCKPDMRVSTAWVELEARKRESLYLLPTCKLEMPRPNLKYKIGQISPTIPTFWRITAKGGYRSHHRASTQIFFD